MATTDSESSADAAGQEPEIQADEEWKQRVKAEDAALDEMLNAETSESKAEQSEQATDESPGESSSPTADAAARGGDSHPPPPATFEEIVGMFSTQAMLALGIIPNPASGKTEKLPDLAKHFIDLLAVLETKTAGNLEPHEQTLLEASLHQLRMTYVETTKR